MRVATLLVLCMLLLTLTQSNSFLALRSRITSFSVLATSRIMSTSRPTAAAASTLASPIEQDNKRIPAVSMTTFVMTTAFIPVWASTILPLSVIYQAGSAALKPITKLIAPKEKAPKLDSGYVVDSITPRSERKYDIVVLGATGFTGKLAARHLAKTYGVNKTVQWAIAGRTQTKLETVKQELANELGIDDVMNVDTIVCDTAVPSTLPKLVNNTRVVATTAGPYTLYGSPVVEFAAKYGTHYVDITGEVDWVKAMLCQWQETAQKTGAKIISFCGHDSIPWDLSVMKMQEKMRTECNDDLKTVTFWDEMNGAAPGGTYATIFNGVTGKSLKPPRCDFDPFLRLPDGSKSEYVCKADLPILPAKCDSPFTEDSSRWTTPFVMAVVNQQVVRWSYALRSQGSKYTTYKEVAVQPDFKTAFATTAGMVMLGSMLFNPVTAYLLKKYAVTQPGDGPSMNAMLNKHFLCVKGEAIGEKGNRVESIFYLPKDAGCLETSRMLIESGLCLALEEDKLPTKRGGFMSTAAGLGDVLMERLIKTGTQFESQSIRGGSARSKL